MTARRYPCEHRWDPGILDGTLPRGASFADLDAYAEIGGRFLFIEHKPAGYAWEPGNGQYRALKALARLPGCIVWFLRDTDGGYEVRSLGTAEPLTFVTLEQLRQRIAFWAAEND